MIRGNAIVGQSGGPTAAINATLAGVVRGAFESEYIGKIYMETKERPRYIICETTFDK